MALALLTEEETWWRQHPSPEFDLAGSTLTLWNYPVNKVDLEPGHKQAIDRFLSIERLREGAPLEVELSIRGHASPTGERWNNSELAVRRAQAVRSYLMELGAQRTLVTLSSAGANEPVNGDQSGQALARNRRVVITKFTPTPKPTPVDVGPILPGEPPAADPPFDPVKGVQFEVSKDFGPFLLVSSPLVIDLVLSGTFKFSSKNQNDGVVIGSQLKKGKFSGKFEKELFDGVAAKFQIGPPKAGSGIPDIQAGTQFADVMGKPTVGFQTPDPKRLPPRFAFVKFEPLDELVLWKRAQDPGTKITFKGEIKFQIGLGEALIRKLAELEARLGGTAAAQGFTAAELSAAGIGGGLATTLAAVGGAIAVAVLVNGAVIAAVQHAKDEADQYTALLARRDGRAARIAWAILGSAFEPQFLDRLEQWQRATSSTLMVEAFTAGRRDVEAFLTEEAARDAKVAAWKSRYAADGSQDGAVIRDRAYQDLGGLDKDPNAGSTL